MRPRHSLRFSRSSRAISAASISPFAARRSTSGTCSRHSRELPQVNILVVHEVEWSSKVVYEVHEIPELLARRGHRVVFIDYEESYKRAGCFDVARVRTKVRPRAHLRPH